MQQWREEVQIIRSMWTQDQATFEGKYFKIDGAWCYPRPVSPKIWVGGVGEQTLSRIVADLADGWNAVGLSADEYARKLEILRLFCENAGRKLNTIKRSYTAPVWSAVTRTSSANPSTDTTGSIGSRRNRRRRLLKGCDPLGPSLGQRVK